MMGATDIRIKYNDILLFLILVPLINALNYYLTYTDIPFNTHTLVTFVVDTIEGYAAWWGLRSVVILLDKRMPYTVSPLKRVIVQLVVTSVVSLLIIIVLTETLNYLVKSTPVPASFYRYDIFIFLIWFLVLNGIYIGLYYFNAVQHIQELRLNDKKIRTDGFLIRQGKQNLSIPFSDITGFYVEGEYTVAVTIALKKHFLDQSLDKIEQLLPSEMFFRLNRQYIINRTSLKGFRREQNGKLNVLVTCTEFFPETVQVSRTKAPAFKEWYQP